KEKNDERLDLFWGLIYTFTHLGVYANNKINSLHFLEYLPTAHALILILTCYLIRKRTSIIENNGVRVENNGVRVN
ncbi:MAG: hypothetical protein P8I94_04505, partial [Emcibacteraceae bacterium]|nr:hypothetical protein [Emcibacteraceae bacterium]